MDTKDPYNIFLNGYEEYADAIFRFAYLRVNDRDRAKDIMQETFTRTWNYLRENRPVENMRAFLYQTARRIIIDESRKRPHMSLDELRKGGFDPGKTHPIEARADLALIHDMLETLEPEYREVFVMRFFEEFTPKEIAEITGENANAVSVKIHRAAKKIREKLRHE